MNEKEKINELKKYIKEKIDKIDNLEFLKVVLAFVNNYKNKK